MLAKPLQQSDLEAAPWKGYEHRPNIVLMWEVTHPCAFITAHDGENLYLRPGEFLCTDGKLGEFTGEPQRYWKLTADEADKLYRRVEP